MGRVIVDISFYINRITKFLSAVTWSIYARAKVRLRAGVIIRARHQAWAFQGIYPRQASGVMVLIST